MCTVSDIEMNFITIDLDLIQCLNQYHFLVMFSLCAQVSYIGPCFPSCLDINRTDFDYIKTDSKA